MSLRARIAALVAVVVALVVVVVGMVVHRSTESALVGEVDADLVERAELLGGPAETRQGRGRPVLQEDELVRLQQFEQFRGLRTDPFGELIGFDALARVLDETGRVRVVLDLEFEASTDADLLDRARLAPILTDGMAAAGPQRVVTAALPSRGFVQFARSLNEVDSVLADLRSKTYLIGTLAILGAAILAWLLAGRTVRPIRALTSATEEIAATGNVDQWIGAVPDRASATEVGRLSASFSSMLVALSESRRQQRQLVMDASHELRTPLTSLRTNIDVLQRGHVLDDHDRSALVADVDAELDELSDLVAELVDLATDVRNVEDVAPLTLAEVAEPVIGRARRRTGRSIELVESRTVVLEARPEAVGRAVRNLVDNAAKFSPEGSLIRVVIDGGTLTVHDEGAGIPEAERAAVFDRFHRVESSRSLPGSGLGLAIVRQVVEAHDGTVVASASPHGGAAVGFRLPTVDD